MSAFLFASESVIFIDELSRNIYDVGASVAKNNRVVILNFFIAHSFIIFYYIRYFGCYEQTLYNAGLFQISSIIFFYFCRVQQMSAGRATIKLLWCCRMSKVRAL